MQDINEQNPALGTNTWKTDMNNRVSSMNRMNWYELSMIFHFLPVNFMALSIHQDSWDLWEGPGETLAGSSLDPQCKDL